jgi:malate/lactate dehydrogenase
MSVAMADKLHRVAEQGDEVVARLDRLTAAMSALEERIAAAVRSLEEKVAALQFANVQAHANPIFVPCALSDDGMDEAMDDSSEEQPMLEAFDQK